MDTSYEAVTLEAVGWPVLWGPGQPEATVLASGLEVVLIHPAREPTAWGLVRFVGPESVRYGSPNLEIVDAHPLGDRAKPGELYVVHGSPWRLAVETMNATHPAYDAAYWSRVRHYFAFLWDYTFECLASDVDGELLEMEFRDAIACAISSVSVCR